MTNSPASIVRSWLYVPGHKERMIEKSFGLPADAVIYDFEDAVPVAEKQTARDMLTSMLGRVPPAGSPRRYVRVNHPSHAEVFEADLACAVSLGIEGVGLPKIERPDEVHYVSEMLDGYEREAGIAIGTTRIMLLVESPLGLVNAHAIAASSQRIIAVAFGGEDFSREMGLPLVRTGEAKELTFARSTVAIACAAAGVQSIDVIWTDLGDNDGVEREAEQARRLGYTGKAAIHPAQIEPINRAFSPTAEEVAYAHEVMVVYDGAVAAGTGAINYNGTFLEEPVIARARHVLDMAKRT